MEIAGSKDPSSSFYLQREMTKQRQDQLLHEEHVKHEARLKNLQKDQDEGLKHLEETQEQRLHGEMERYQNARDQIKAKQARLLEEERRKGESVLRNLKQTQEKHLGELEFLNQQRLKDTSREGRLRLQETQKNQSEELKYVEQTGKNQIEHKEAVLAEDIRILDALKDQKLRDAKQAILKIDADSQAGIQRLREEQETKLRMETSQGQERYKEELGRMEAQFRGEKTALMKDHQTWLDWSDAAQEKDPFFQLFRLPFEVHTDDASVTVVIPRDLGGHMEIRTSIQDKYFVLSGTRQNKHEALSDEGQRSYQATSQSFTEKIPLGFPIDQKRVQHFKETDRDRWVLPRLI